MKEHILFPIIDKDEQKGQPCLQKLSIEAEFLLIY
jgi:hypothetical protein